MTATTIVEAFAAAAARLTQPADMMGGLVSLLGDLVALIDADSAGILLQLPGEELALLASTSHTTSMLALYELQSSSGPGPEAIKNNFMVEGSSPGLAEQWSPVGREIIDAGLNAVHAFPLRWGDRAVGTLEVYDATSRSLDEDQLQLGQAFANMAMVQLFRTQHADWDDMHDQIVELLSGRIAIEQAKGVLAVQQGLDLATAYDWLISTASARGVALADLADEVVNALSAPSAGSVSS